MELSGLSPAHRYNTPLYNLPTMLSARSSRFGVNRAPALFGYLTNREYGVSSPAGRKALRQYLIKHAAKLEDPPSHQVLDHHEDNINQLLQVDERTLVSVSSDKTIKCFTGSPSVASGRHLLEWQLSQVLGDPEQEIVEAGSRHQDVISDIGCLSDDRIVSCSHDGQVILWERQNGLWNDIETIDTGKFCSDIAVLSSTVFAVSTSTGSIGIFQYEQGQYHPWWHDSHSGFVFSLTVIDEKEFVSFSLDGVWKDWRLHQNRWSPTGYPCPENISGDGNNYPVIGVLLQKRILAIGYSQGDIIIRWKYLSSLQDHSPLQDRWHKMQALRHGEESESIKGIRALTESRFASYGDDAKIVLWQLKGWQWADMQRLDIHEYPVSDCLSVGHGFFWTIDHSGVIECWYQLGDEWIHCRNIKVRRDDFSDQFIRTSRLIVLNDKVTVVSFSEDCVINLWLLNPQAR